MNLGAWSCIGVLAWNELRQAFTRSSFRDPKCPERIEKYYNGPSMKSNSVCSLLILPIVLYNISRLLPMQTNHSVFICGSFDRAQAPFSAYPFIALLCGPCRACRR